MEGTERVEKLLAMLLLNGMQDAQQSKKISTLRGVGFSNAEIADILGTSTALVSQHLYLARKKPKSKRGKK